MQTPGIKNADFRKKATNQIDITSDLIWSASLQTLTAIWESLSMISRPDIAMAGLALLRRVASGPAPP
jgi:hypothetical protein